VTSGLVSYATIRSVDLSVLIVDDHPTFRRFARMLLEQSGIAVVGEAADGATAIAAARGLQPDVVLLDVLLPDTTGFAVAEKLAAEPRPPAVVLTSSRSAAELGPLASTEPARTFVAKSDLSAAALRAAVDAATR
jgi:DNA-binding NarL/FixJ family response regulator